MKAKFLCKYYGSNYEKNILYLEYEYRGYKYTVYQNLSKGNEFLSWQHRNEQDRIDKLIDEEENQTNQNDKNNISIDQSLADLLKYWDS